MKIIKPEEIEREKCFKRDIKCCIFSNLEKKRISIKDDVSNGINNINLVSIKITPRFNSCLIDMLNKISDSDEFKQLVRNITYNDSINPSLTFIRNDEANFQIKLVLNI